MNLPWSTALNILIGLVMLASDPLVAASTTENLLTTYAVTDAVLQDPECKTLSVAPPQKVTPQLGGLNLGICLFHRFDTREHNQRAIETLQQAQLAGLNPNDKAVAQFLEGLLHCRQARHYRAEQLVNQDVSPARSHNTPSGNVAFCLERRLGLTAVTNLNWDQSVINYAPVSTTIREDGALVAKPDYQKRVEELEACYDEEQNGPFHPNFATACREDAASDKTTVTKLATTETETLLNAYLGSANPFGAIFSRKVDLVKDVQQRSVPKIAELTAQVAQLRAAYIEQAKRLKENQERIDPLIQRYQGALLLGYQIMDNYERWIKQFWLHPTEGDLEFPLREDCQKLANQTASLQESTKLPQRKNCLGSADANAPIKATDIDTLGRIVDSIKGIETGAAEQKVAIKKMCQLYFCHLLAYPVLGKTSRLCARALTSNPLCKFDTANVQAVIGIDQANSISVVNLCRNAGLPEEFLKVGLEPNQKAACFANN